MASEHIKIKKNGYVWFLVHRRELIEQTIDTFKKMNIAMDNIFVGMVQSVTRHPDKYREPTMIIFDEAHHATANTWLSIIEKYPTIPIIGLTATPARTNGDSLGKVFDCLIEGVSSEYLMDNGYLCEYDYYAPKLNIPKMFKTKGNDFDVADIAEQFEKAKIHGDILKYIDMKRKTIIYCPTIKFSKGLAERIPNAVHFDGKTPKAERDKIVQDFRDGKIRVLLSVDLIGEGFDIPDCDCVILLRPTLSTVLYIQQAMRCLRPAPNKRAVIYDMVGNCYRFGMPTDRREWSLTGRTKCSNINGEPDVKARMCGMCYKTYGGINAICPYCGYDNGKSRKQIEEDKKAELEKIEKINKYKKKQEVWDCMTETELIKLGTERGYKNAGFWAKQIINSRRRKRK